ncbi:nitrilase-related carbon-nitrogen hydrolase [Natronosalvus rutilus]|uniref:CN hydrolase domain-containing protein n=1 Tax=Natronosalvus rutilus TaxID=2953753 RepID=A0A9E7NDU2_9EURY|nr:nitrilase-related carbon-nitrogen hydrolase [Natronosalvus rutilus]UTF55666.1 hypothetical protein NGM29_19930 [Natronosalvus rutilus]
MSQTTFDVALCQYAFGSVKTIDAFWERITGLFERCGPADMYILPELIGYDVAMSNSREEYQLRSSEIEEFHDKLAGEASDRDAIIVGGSYRVSDEGELYNRAPIALPDGSLRTYTKQRPVPAEREDGVASGSHGGPIFEHNGVSAGVLICYDAEFPDVVRDVVERGAEVIALPSLTGSVAGYQRVSRCSAARAVENQAYVLQVPLVGTHPHGQKCGTGRASCFAPCDDIAGPDGTRLTLPADEHAVGVQRLDVDLIRKSRSSASVRPFSDRLVFE